MSRGSTPPIWPLSIVFVFAMAMSLTAPRSWERVAQRFELGRAMPLSARSAVAVAAKVSEPPVVDDLPTLGVPAQPIGRVAAEFTALPKPATIDLPQPQLNTTLPLVASTVSARPGVAAIVEEPPTLDRPRLSGGFLRSSSPTLPSIATPSLPKVETVLVPENRPTLAPIQPTLPPIEPAPQATPTLATAPPAWWPKPVGLLERLEKLGGYPSTQTWAERATESVQRLIEQDDLLAPQVATLLADLRQSTADSMALDERALDNATLVELRLTRHALVRRLDVWESLVAVAGREAARHESPPAAGARQLELCLVELETQTAAAGDVGRQWHDYLLLDALGHVTPHNCDDVDGQRLAREVIDRIGRARATPEHREFLDQGPFAQLHGSLRLLTEEDVDPRQLLLNLEQVEQGGLPSDGGELARLCDQLSSSGDEAKRKLALQLGSHYRNANVRITFAPEILNRLLPDELKRQAPVADTILGKETRGWSTTRTGLSVQFLPNADRVAVRLAADGVVNAHTRTLSGPVRLFNFSNSAFRAEKDIEVTTAGVQVKPAVAASQNNTRLKAIESDFDGMPIIGSIITAIAHNQHADKKPAAQREAASKTSQHVERNLDVDIDRHLVQADAKLHERILTPLERIRIVPEIVDLQSTVERATMRFRVSGDDQLAAGTPRPRAYADNVASVQIHQSAINNVIDRLGLQSRHFTLPEFYGFVVERLGLPGTADVSKLPPELEMTFAAVDPLTIRCEDGRLELRMAFDELKFGDRTWRNFAIRAPFRPDVTDEKAYFVRDGVVRISGGQIGTAGQISLRTVFAKIFPEDLHVKLWPERLSNDPRFAELDIEQIDLRDGWIGAAIGTRRVAVVVAPETSPAPSTAILPRLLRK